MTDAFPCLASELLLCASMDSDGRGVESTDFNFKVRALVGAYVRRRSWRRRAVLFSLGIAP
jgi:hypothetical protein